MLVAAATVASCGALTLRIPATLSMDVLVPVGLLGAFGAVPARTGSLTRPDRHLVIALGLVPFLLIRIVGPPLPAEITPMTVFAPTVAAITEEAFFRRFVYGWLEARGPALAMVGSAILFAVIHIPVYGPGVVFIDFGAGLIFGYQRWISGSWVAPAATHAIVNLIQLPWSA
jgi:membrane protease YdiL (CAAX protease family)